MHSQHLQIGMSSDHVHIWAGNNMVKASSSGQASSRAVSGRRCPFRARWARLRAPQAAPLGPVWAQRGGHPRPAAPRPGGCPGRNVPRQRGHEQQPVHQLAGHALGHHRPAAGTSSGMAGCHKLCLSWLQGVPRVLSLPCSTAACPSPSAQGCQQAPADFLHHGRYRPPAEPGQRSNVQLQHQKLT